MWKLFCKEHGVLFDGTLDPNFKNEEATTRATVFNENSKGGNCIKVEIPQDFLFKIIICEFSLQNTLGETMSKISFFSFIQLLPINLRAKTNKCLKKVALHRAKIVVHKEKENRTLWG